MYVMLQRFIPSVIETQQEASVFYERKNEGRKESAFGADLPASCLVAELQSELDLTLCTQANGITERA